MDRGLYTQVNNSPRPEGSANNTPSITKGREGKRVGKREGKETTNIYLLSLLSLFFKPFLHDLRLAVESLTGSGEISFFMKTEMKLSQLSQPQYTNSLYIESVLHFLLWNQLNEAT